MLRVSIVILGLTYICSAYNNGMAKRPAMGWNTWCSIDKCGTDICNQWEVVDVAKAMKENGMLDAGYNHVNMDDCWDACDRAKNGQIQPDPDRFPDGIKALADNLHSLGFNFGLYTSAGSNTCSGGTRSNCHPPGSYGHYANDTQTFADWGVDYVKIDWCGSDLNNAKQQHTEFSNDLNATGRHIWLELCRGYTYPPPAYVAQVANSWRIAGDHHDEWSSTASAIAKSANATNLSGQYNWGYNDFLMTGGQGCSGDRNPNVTHPHCAGQSDTEYYTEYSMWTIINSPLLVATDVRNMTDIMKKVLLNAEVIAVNQNYQFPAGNIVSALTNDCDSNVKNACQVWSKQVSATSAAIVLYNSGSGDHDIKVDFSKIPNMQWTSSTKLDVRDLWEQKDIGSFTGSFESSSKIPAHGVLFVTATSS